MPPHPDTYVFVQAWTLAAQTAFAVADSDEEAAHDTQARLRRLALRTDQPWFLPPTATPTVTSSVPVQRQAPGCSPVVR